MRADRSGIVRDSAGRSKGWIRRTASAGVPGAARAETAGPGGRRRPRIGPGKAAGLPSETVLRRAHPAHSQPLNRPDPDWHSSISPISSARYAALLLDAPIRRRGPTPWLLRSGPPSSMAMDTIRIRGARTHNLKNLDLTCRAIADRDHRPVRVGQVLARLRHDLREASAATSNRVGLRTAIPQRDGEADVDHIEGLSPAISIEQKSTRTIRVRRAHHHRDLRISAPVVRARGTAALPRSPLSA